MNSSERGFEASRTAQWVAVARTMGGLLPRELLLACDPYGVEFAQGGLARAARLLLHLRWLSRPVVTCTGPLAHLVLWMQLRTRAIDDVLLDFVGAGGRQVVLLGAGYDTRALRFKNELSRVTVFEVDHPATQTEKRARLPAQALSTDVVYLGWDFERDPIEELPSRLEALGLDPTQPVLTIWEGVTMYLEPSTVEATVRAVQRFTRGMNVLALSYIDRRRLERPHVHVKVVSRFVARAGEPWRFGWDPDDFPRWFSARGFALVSDVSDAELAARFFPARVWYRFAKKTHRLAIVRGRDAAPEPKGA